MATENTGMFVPYVISFWGLYWKTCLETFLKLASGPKIVPPPHPKAPKPQNQKLRDNVQTKGCFALLCLVGSGELLAQWG
eukprot:2061448-Amphidinium_carterae.1